MKRGASFPSHIGKQHLVATGKGVKELDGDLPIFPMDDGLIIFPAWRTFKTWGLVSGVRRKFGRGPLGL